MAAEMERMPVKATPFRGPGRLEMWELTAGTARAEVAPSRGGLVTRFSVDGDEVLFLDPATLVDRTQNVRGGIPVLFPIAGALDGDQFEHAGRTHVMRQHGLARQAAFEVISVGQAALTMEWKSNPASKASFPFDFSLQITVDVGRAGQRTLAMDLKVTNLGTCDLPMHLGLHPYFAVLDRDKPALNLRLPGHQVFDNHNKQDGPYAGELDFAAPVQDLHLTELYAQRLTLQPPGKRARVISWSDLFQCMVFWSLPRKDFVCIEPWSARGNALNSGQGLIWLKPGQSKDGAFSITVE